MSAFNTELGRKRHHNYHNLASYSQCNSIMLPMYYKKVPHTVLFPITAAKSGFHCTMCYIQNGTQKLLHTQFQFAAALKSYVCKGTDKSLQSLKGLLELIELYQRHQVQTYIYQHSPWPLIVIPYSSSKSPNLWPCAEPGRVFHPIWCYACPTLQCRCAPLFGFSTEIHVPIK